MWITERAGAERTQMGRPRFRRFAEAAGIRKRKLPGIEHIQYNAEDIDRALRESIIDPASRGEELLGIKTDENDETGTASALFLADQSEAAPRTHTPKRRGCSQR